MTVSTINGAWSDDANAWVSETLCLTGDGWLEMDLAGKGRLVIKKGETENGPMPKALITHWTGPKFRIRIYGATEGRYVRIYTTSEPETIQLVNI